MNAIEVECPYCGRPPRERCRTGAGMPLQAGEVHTKRRDAAAEATAYERLAERIVEAYASLSDPERAELAARYG